MLLALPLVEAASRIEIVERIHRHLQRMMLVHHAVTLLLIAASWQIGLQEVGCVMFWLHDASDIGIDALKLVSAWGTAQLPPLALPLVYVATLVAWRLQVQGGGQACR